MHSPCFAGKDGKSTSRWHLLSTFFLLLKPSFGLLSILSYITQLTIYTLVFSNALCIIFSSFHQLIRQRTRLYILGSLHTKLCSFIKSFVLPVFDKDPEIDQITRLELLQLLLGQVEQAKVWQHHRLFGRRVLTKLLTCFCVHWCCTVLNI